MTAILGGGIGGLSAGFFSLQNPKVRSVVVAEASNRLGGWVRSERSPSGKVFEKGPRTVRVSGPMGKLSLMLVDRLNLSDQLVPITLFHPAARNRLIFAKDTMVLVPNDFAGVFKTIPPFTKPLYRVVLSEMFKPSVKVEDESVYSFAERRMGKEIADYLLSPIIAGIFAGDAKQLSVKAFASKLFDIEQKHGSVVKGVLKERFFGESKDSKGSSLESDPNLTASVLMSDSISKAQMERWSIWTMKDGLETLPKTLGKTIQKLGADIRLRTVCEGLNFKSDGVEVLMNSKKEHFENVISSLPAWTLAKLVKSQHPKLAHELEGIPAVDVAVVNLEFEQKLAIPKGFGFLVAPIENRPILGVIFDSMMEYPDYENTCLTVMMGGAWYDKHFKNAKEEDLLSVAVSQVQDILKIEKNPVSHHVSILRKCIPQYVIGHTTRIERIRNYISTNKLPLQLCGSSYDGVGINNVIFSGKSASEGIGNSTEKKID